MPRDYYTDLEIKVDASHEEICQAYRRLALRFHPKFSIMDEKTTHHHFSIISEAFEVLSDPMRRAFYDKFGEEQLKQGFFHKGELAGGYKFHKNPLEIFEKFLCKYNPLADIVDLTGEHAHGTMFGYQFQAQNYQLTHPPEPVYLEVECSLEEIYNGCSKEIQYYRSLLNQDGRTTREILANKIVQIRQGVKDGATVVYKKEGNQAARFDNSDLVMIIREVPHSRFKRKGNDLVYTQTINLSQSWSFKGVHLITLDSRRLYIPIDEVITPKTVKVVEGEGMPIQFETLKGLKNKQLLQPYKDRGNLIIKFNVEFPTQLSIEELKKISELLGEKEENGDKAN
ncbi:hypothetical protein ABPG72_014241 [Tetrahymena utriculariae]